jgi:hypothetical protein
MIYVVFEARRMFSVLRWSLNCVGALLAGIELSINGFENGIKDIL